MARQVTVYSTPLCAPCEALKSYLRRQGVSFAVRDLLLDEEAAERLETAGIRTTPVLEVDGELLAGPALTPEAVDALLGL